MTDAFTQLSTQVPDGFGALLAKSNEAAKPELEKQQAAEEEFAKAKRRCNGRQGQRDCQDQTSWHRRRNGSLQEVRQGVDGSSSDHSILI